MPRTLDKRISPEWLYRCYKELPPRDPLPTGCPALPDLEIYALPQPGHRYVIGADPAEGNPTSDDSALTILDRDIGEEVAALAGKFQPSTFAANIDALGMWFNKADVLVERNNHGHAVLLGLRDHSGLYRLRGLDGHEGWLSNSKGKALLYDTTADAFREGTTQLRSFATFTQLASIEGATLRAADGEADDRADSYALACAACRFRPPEPYRGPLVCWPDVPFGSETAVDLFANPLQGAYGRGPEPGQSVLQHVFNDLDVDLEGDW